MNFPKVLLITMNDGIDPASGKRFAPSFGHFKDMKSFDELQTAWDKTLRHLTRMSVIVETLSTYLLKEKYQISSVQL